jgi:hypothetical protein
MNYMLSNHSTRALQTLSGEAWSRMLHLAMFYGWQPMGTLPPLIHNLRGRTPGDWDGTYLRAEGQTVREQDALDLAIALRFSLDDIPDVNPERDLTLEDDLPEWLSPAEKASIDDGLDRMEYQEGLDEDGQERLGILPFEFFAGDGKQNLVDFIHFCMLGEFVIS